MFQLLSKCLAGCANNLGIKSCAKRTRERLWKLKNSFLPCSHTLGTAPLGPRLVSAKPTLGGCWKTARFRAMNAPINAPTMKSTAPSGRLRENVKKILNTWTSIVPDHARNARQTIAKTRMITARPGPKKDTAARANMPITWSCAANSPVETAEWRNNCPSSYLFLLLYTTFVKTHTHTISYYNTTRNEHTAIIRETLVFCPADKPNMPSSWESNWT